MDRQHVADALEEIGLLLELLGENPFKTRAYHNGARIIRSFDRDLGEVVRRKELTQIKGIGAALADKISTLVEERRLPYLEQLRAQVPAGLLEWLKIPGLGAKKARAIHVALGISTVGELEYACAENRLRDLDGFGEKSQKKILAGIERLRRHAGRFRQPVVREEAQRLLDLVRGLPGVQRAEVGGSVRRCSETSKDIDIVVSADRAETVMEAFAGAPDVEEITGRGPTKCSVRLVSGPSADLRVVDEESFPFALMYFTGSKAHNIRLRGRAQKLGYKLNEYALVEEESSEGIGCRDEAAIYERLGLGYIEPELREDTGEIEAAEGGDLPSLIEYDDLQGVLHCHSNWSDGTATIEEMAEAARGMGLTYLGLCDHSQSAAYAGGLDARRVREQHVEIDGLNRRYGEIFRVLKGIEVDILADGTLDFPDEVLRSFDLVVASVHSRFNLGESQQTERILRALDNPYVDTLGHATGRLLLARDGYELDLTRVLEAAAERGISVEVNAHPSRLDLDWRNLRYGLNKGMKTSINPDAHATNGLRDMEYGVGVARKGWCTKDDVLNAWRLERLLEYLRNRRRDAGVES
jgi:DNA polymerase (family 10)